MEFKILNLDFFLMLQAFKHQGVVEKYEQPIRGMDVQNMLNLLQENNMQNFYPRKEWVRRIDRDWIINVSLYS